MKSLESIIHELKTVGVAEIHNYLSSSDADQLQHELFNNHDQIIPIQRSISHQAFSIKGNIFNPYPLLSSKVIASRSVLNLDLLNIDFAVNGQTYLKNLFAYNIQNTKQAIFDWHIDNYNEFEQKKDGSNGLVFLLYLNDSEDGGTEFLLGSDEYSNKNDTIFFDKHDKNLLQFESYYIRPQKGKLVIAKSCIIHRGATGLGLQLEKISRPTLRWQSTTNSRNTTEVAILTSQLIVSPRLAEYLHGCESKSETALRNISANMTNLTLWKTQLSLLSLVATILKRVLIVSFKRVTASLSLP